MSQTQTEVDVVILGAGASGLAAASALQAKKIPYVVLEARDRVGGRMFTEFSSHGHVELGAELVHGPAEPIRAWAKRLGLSFEPLDREWQLLAEVGEEETQSVEQKIALVVNELEDQRADVPVKEFLSSLAAHHDPKTLEIAQHFFEGYHGADLQKFGTESLREAGAGGLGEVDRLKEGYSSLIEGIAKTVSSLELNWPVRRVGWAKGKVEVWERGGTRKVVAKAAIITLPLAVLQGRARSFVEFLPALEEKQKPLAVLEMGSILKLTLSFKTEFWNKTPLGSQYVFVHLKEECPFHVLWVGPSQSLVAWAGGRKAEAMGACTHNERTALAVETIAEALDLSPAEVEKQLEKSYCHDWSEDPLTGGAYSYGGIGAKGAFAELGAPVKDTLFFAGEATHPEKNATVDGALESGERVAREVTLVLRRSLA